jgi:hypothetical protein
MRSIIHAAMVGHARDGNDGGIIARSMKLQLSVATCTLVARVFSAVYLLSRIVRDEVKLLALRRVDGIPDLLSYNRMVTGLVRTRSSVWRW